MGTSSQTAAHLHIVPAEPAEWTGRMRSLEAERLRPSPRPWHEDRWDGSPKRRREALAAELGCPDDYKPLVAVTVVMPAESEG